MPHELEMRMTVQMLDIPLRPREEIVGADDLVPLFEEPVDEVGAEETRSAGDEDAFATVVETPHVMPFHQFGSASFILSRISATVIAS